MKWFGFGKKAEPISEESIGDVSYTKNDEHGIFKSYIPEFLYKPPFGYPRPENLPLIKQLAKNPYIFSVIKTLCDEVASTNYDIVYKDEAEPTPQLDEEIKRIKRFFCNPNANKESFNHLLRAMTKDILEVDSGVWIKVFNKKGEFTQLIASDGASYLKNPDIHGYLGNRADIITPLNINYTVTKESPEYAETFKKYELAYKNDAAYFQYGWTAAALPVPFGKREVIYVMQNSRSDSPYGLSPVQILADIIMTLVYGANYNLDFYMNNNMPEGIITLLGANSAQVKAFRERLDARTKVKDEATGFWRKLAFKIPISTQVVGFKPFQLDPKTMQILEQQRWFSKIVWGAFGVNADEMGFTEDSNRATGENQFSAYKRKAVRPLLDIIKYKIDMEIIPEFSDEAFENLEFKWNDYDIDEDKKKHDLYEQQIRMGIKTPEMVAQECGIDFTDVKQYNEEKEKKEEERFEKENSFNNKPENESNDTRQDTKDDKKENLKSEKPENELEAEMVSQIKNRTKQIIKSLEMIKNSPLKEIK